MTIVSLTKHSRVENPDTVPEASGEHWTDAYAAISTGAGIATLDDRLIVRIVGDDRIPFMHGMCSNDIKGLASGVVAPALILTEHAHIIADFFVYADADALLIEIDRALWPKARAHLEKFLVADDVEFEELDNLGVIDVEGPAAAKVAATVAGESAESLPTWCHAEFDGVRYANLLRFGGPAFTLLVERARIASMIEALKARGLSTGVREIAAVGAETLEILRVEHGIVRVGVDTVEKSIALEARLDAAISFSKGCYVGQETIERATARGGVKKKLFGVRIEGDRVPLAGGAIMLGGREVGRLTSVVQSPRLGIIGLSIIHHSAWQTGTRVTIADAAGESVATVCELPFV
jgi:folate-binding protein YgfZ